jgi:hypothetical protein
MRGNLGTPLGAFFRSIASPYASMASLFLFKLHPKFAPTLPAPNYEPPIFLYSINNLLAVLHRLCPHLIASKSTA